MRITLIDTGTLNTGYCYIRYRYIGYWIPVHTILDTSTKDIGYWYTEYWILVHKI